MLGKERIIEEAEQLVFETGNPLDVFRRNGGPAVSVIVSHLMENNTLNQERLDPNEVLVAARTIADSHGLIDYYPKTALVREMVSLTMALLKVMDIALSQYGKNRENYRARLFEIVAAVSSGFDSVEDAMVMDYDMAIEIRDEVEKNIGLV